MIIELKYQGHTLMKVHLWTLVTYELFTGKITFSGDHKQLILTADGEEIPQPAVWENEE